MALEDLFSVVESFSRAMPSGDVNISYYLVLLGAIILGGFAVVTLTTLTVRAFLLVFRKSTSYAIKLILVVGLILFLVGLLMP
ncbi:MAG: hypothetical protein RRE21_07550 [Desulfurococcales archaeon]|nr:hypothetical protein [Desulfurococcales archaeon]